MITQLARMVEFNIAGLILCLALILAAPPRGATLRQRAAPPLAAGAAKQESQRKNVAAH
jgi:hypothetical protein